MQGFDCGSEVAGWLSENLGTSGLRLFRQSDSIACTAGWHSTQGNEYLRVFSLDSIVASLKQFKALINAKNNYIYRQ